MTRFVLALSGTLFMAICLLGICSQTDPNSPIAVRIEAKNSSPRSGEPVSITVALTNLSNEDLLVGRMLTGVGINPGDITFEVTNLPGQPERGERSATDCFVRSNPDPLPVAVMKRWIALPPHTSFTTSVILDPTLLGPPGRHKVTATYESRGVKEQYWTDCVHATPDEVAKLPFRAWEGRSVSNSIWITVRAK
jgi:hypothetical protein